MHIKHDRWNAIILKRAKVQITSKPVLLLHAHRTVECLNSMERMHLRQNSTIISGIFWEWQGDIQGLPMMNSIGWPTGELGSSWNGQQQPLHCSNKVCRTKKLILQLLSTGIGCMNMFLMHFFPYIPWRGYPRGGRQSSLTVTQKNERIQILIMARNLEVLLCFRYYSISGTAWAQFQIKQ